VGECFRAYTAGSHSLEAVVADGRGGVKPGGDIASVDDSALARGIAPDSGQAVGLEFQADRELVGAAGVAFFETVNFRLNAEQLLDVVADFMGHDVSLGKFARRTEAVAQFIEEAEIQIDLFVFGAVERPDLFAGKPASGPSSVAKENETGVVVRSSGGLREHGVPGPLDIIENEGDELDFRLLALVQGSIGNATLGLYGGGAGEVTEKVLMKNEAEDAEDNDAADAEMGRTDAEAPAAAARIATIFDISADSAGCPFHEISLPKSAERPALAGRF
jgi:hypothetical protein